MFRVIAPVLALALLFSLFPQQASADIRYGGPKVLILSVSKKDIHVKWENLREDKTVLVVTKDGKQTDFEPYTVKSSKGETRMKLPDSLPSGHYKVEAKDEKLSTVAVSEAVPIVTPAPTCQLKADKTSVKQGEIYRLVWKTRNAFEVRLQDKLVGRLGVERVSSHSTGTRSFTLTAKGKGGTATCTAKVTVTD